MATLDEVTRRSDRVLIVASGPSAEELDLVELTRSRGFYVLAVNQAVSWLNELWNGWFTLDLDRKNLRTIRGHKYGREYYAAVPSDYGRSDAGVSYHRDVPKLYWVHYLQRVSGDGPFGSCYGLRESPREISTGNSAYGALGAVYHMRPSRVGLIGVDANGRNYAYLPGRSWNGFDHVPGLFASAVPQLEAAGIEVLNGSRESRVDCFERTGPNEVLEWIKEGT